MYMSSHRSHGGQARAQHAAGGHLYTWRLSLSFSLRTCPRHQLTTALRSLCSCESRRNMRRMHSSQRCDACCAAPLLHPG